MIFYNWDSSQTLSDKFPSYCIKFINFRRKLLLLIVSQRVIIDKFGTFTSFEQFVDIFRLFGYLDRKWLGKTGHITFKQLINVLFTRHVSFIQMAFTSMSIHCCCAFYAFLSFKLLFPFILLTFTDRNEKSCFFC